MRADAIDLDIAGPSLRVLCDDPVGIEMLRADFADHLIDQPSAVGFSLRVPSGGTTFHVLLDRSGSILARARSTEECLAVLRSHLAALLPPPPDTIRLRAHAILLDNATAALVAHPLFVHHPPIERRLQRASLRLVDRLVVDVRPDGSLLMAAAQWDNRRRLPQAGGHSAAPTEATRIETVVVPQIAHETPTRAEVVALLAASMCSGSHGDRLALAERLAERNVVIVPVGDAMAVYAALIA